MENIDSKIKERGRGWGIHPKLFPSAKPKQLNHHIRLTLEENKYDGGIPAFFISNNFYKQLQTETCKKSSKC